MLPLRASMRKSASVIRCMRGLSPIIIRSAPISSSVVVRMRKDWSPFNVEDYPKVERISAQRLPPTGHWDNQDRRDRETPLHEDDDALTMWMVNDSYQMDRYTVWQAFGQLAVMLSLLGGLFAYGWWLNVPETRSYAVPKQYPNLYQDSEDIPKTTKEQS